MANARVNSKDVMEEIKKLRVDLQELKKVLIGASDEPDKPGLMERVRSLETNERVIKWLAGLVAIVLVGDVMTRLISWYLGGAP